MLVPIPFSSTWSVADTNFSGWMEALKLWNGKFQILYCFIRTFVFSQDLIDEFNQDPSIPVFFLSTKVNERKIIHVSFLLKNSKLRLGASV